MTDDPAWNVLLLPGVDRTFDALRARRRRLILLGLLTDDIRSEACFDSRCSNREGVDTELHHRHLPMLAELGYVEWDPDSGTIERGSRFDEIEPLLRLLIDHADELPPGWP